MWPDPNAGFESIQESLVTWTEDGQMPKVEDSQDILFSISTMTSNKL